MSTLQEQFSAVRKSQVEAQLSYFHDLTARAVESAQQLMHLNIDTARASLASSTAAVSQMLLVKDPRDLLALTTQSQAGFDSLMNYSRALIGIATSAQPGLGGKVGAPAQSEPASAPVLTAPAENVLATPQPIEVEAPLPVEATPVAKAVKKTAPKPAAASFPSATSSKVVVTGIKPVDAAPPPAPAAGKPAIEAKQGETKSRKKK